MNDGRKKYFIDKRFTIYACIFTSLVVLFIGWRIDQRPASYQDCSEIKVATGQSYIRSSNPLYQSRLDSNHNNIACE